MHINGIKNYSDYIYILPNNDSCRQNLIITLSFAFLKHAITHSLPLVNFNKEDLIILSLNFNYYYCY